MLWAHFEEKAAILDRLDVTQLHALAEIRMLAPWHRGDAGSPALLDDEARLTAAIGPVLPRLCAAQGQGGAVGLVAAVGFPLLQMQHQCLRQVGVAAQEHCVGGPTVQLAERGVVVCHELTDLLKLLPKIVDLILDGLGPALGHPLLPDPLRGPGGHWARRWLEEV